MIQPGLTALVTDRHISRGNALENAQDARLKLAAGKHAVVWRKLVADTETPVGAALKLIEPGRGDFLL